MQESTRNKVLIGVALLLVVLIGAWWFSGFSLDFMRFFAAEPGVTDTTGRIPPKGCFYQDVQCIQAPCDPVIVCPSIGPVPSGCRYQQVQCIQAPCPPQIVCPAPTCIPRPACLDAKPSCDIAEPAGGWCSPGPTDRSMVQCAPATQTVKVGQNATLTANGGNGRYLWFFPFAGFDESVIAPPGFAGGVDPTTGDIAGNEGPSISLSYPTPGTKKVTVQSARGDGSKNVDSVACTVIVEQ